MQMPECHSTNICAHRHTCAGIQCKRRKIRLETLQKCISANNEDAANCSNLFANCLRTNLRVSPFAAVQMDVLGALQQLGKARPPAATCNGLGRASR